MGPFAAEDRFEVIDIPSEKEEPQQVARPVRCDAPELGQGQNQVLPERLVHDYGDRF
jgi:hypothetical protein